MLVLMLTFAGQTAFAEDNIKRFETDLEQYRKVRDVPTAYEADTWATYNKLGKALQNMDPESLEEKDLKKLDAIEAAAEAIVQIRPVEDCIWYIWGDEMPVKENKSDLFFSSSDFDAENFRPFLLHYLLDDQEAAKGNIIIVAGGGYSTRANDSEGYAIAERFRELGYNCYVLQRRVYPYGKEDIWMDLQCSLRYLRYHAEELGLGAQDRYMAIRFSGGSGTVLGAIQYCYGDVPPTVYDTDYLPDAIDAINADFDAVCAMYGPNAEMSSEYMGLVTENENLPEVFIAAGQLDYANAGRDSLTLAASIFDKTKVELHLFADTRHGFALGIGNNNSASWVQLADGFLGRIGN